MQTKHKRSCAVARSAAILACLMLAGSSGLAHAATNYTLTILAKDGDSLGGQKIMLPQGGGINTRGTVVFAASYICGPGGQSCTNIYQTSLSNLAASPSLVQANTFGIPRIDNRGTILFGCAGGALCTQSGVVVKPGDTTGGNGPIFQIQDWAISGSGEIVFLASWQTNNPDGSYLLQFGLLTPSALLISGCESLYSGVNIVPCKGKSGTLIDGTKLFAPGLPVDFGPHGGINFDCGLPPASPFIPGTSAPQAVCSLAHILAQPGTTIGGHTLTAANIVGTTSDGEVVFAGDFDPNSRGIFRLSPSRVLVQPGDTIEGHRIDVVARGVVGNNGRLAVYAHFVDPNGSQGWGIFTRSSLVFREGDAIGGQATTLVSPAAVGDDGSILLDVTFAQAKALVVAERDRAHHDSE
jgi:hypothetical protein